jgi:glycosyltransferase involved in cell wall biosynthesis
MGDASRIDDPPPTQAATDRTVDVMVLGLRGFPDVQGGIERHAENLFPTIARDHSVMVVVRSTYLPPNYPSEWRQVRFKRLWAPRSKAFEAIAHTLLGVTYASVRRPRILHIHGIGPALLTPLARLLGLRVVVTHHGPDYDREKWGSLGRLILRAGEAAGMNFAHRRIVISQTIKELVHTKYGLDSIAIPNGVNLPSIVSTTGALEEFRLTPRRYVLLVSRLVPEKRHLDLLHAFTRAAMPDWKLVFVGGVDHPDAYSHLVERTAADTPGVVTTGFQSGLALRELYSHAGLFVLPSSHEGLPIALLEALSYGLPVLASDIPANCEVGLPLENYFHLGDIEGLAAGIKRFSAKEVTESWRQETRLWVSRRYNWEEIAQSTLAVYASLIGPVGRPTTGGREHPIMETRPIMHQSIASPTSSASDTPRS